MKESIENEMSEETFSDISFQMEREGIFFGSSEDALFNFKVLNDRRILPDGLRNLEFYRDLGIPVPRKTGIEQRILSLDIALLASRKHDNDASCFIINQLLQSSADNQLSNIGYIET